MKFLATSCGYPACSRNNFLGNEPFGSEWRLMIEKHSGTRVEPVSLAVVCDLPEGCSLRYGVRATRPERSVLIGGFIGIAKTLARPGVVQLDRSTSESN